MILGYAWSNFTVLNLVNVKLTYFSNEPFDLLIRSNKTLSNTLLEEVEKQKIFSNIYYIPMPQIDKRLGIIGKIPKLRFWSYKRNYKNKGTPEINLILIKSFKKIFCRSLFDLF